jgi:phosphoenolpyruvate synthase/pyruvate phosphate dikinase
LPPGLREEVESAFVACGEMAGGPCAVAVRSSATAEDSAEFTFAGLHATFLDMRDMADLERAIVRCWASLWSDRAVAYRCAGGLAADDATIAVVSVLVVPDHIAIGPDGGVLEYVLGGKHLVVIPGGGPGEGVREVPVPRAMRGMRTLTDAQAMRVGAAVRGVAGRLGVRADLEGAFAGDGLYFLQARPITTLGARPGG